MENLAADHLSRLENLKMEELDEDEIDDKFPEEDLMVITSEEPWYADMANYLASGYIRKGLTYQQKKKLLSEVKFYFWDDPYLFRSCADGIIRRCIFRKKNWEILMQLHNGPTAGHHGPQYTVRNFFYAGFYWPTIFKDATTFVKEYDAS